MTFAVGMEKWVNPLGGLALQILGELASQNREKKLKI
jgi:hypothetical protein